MVCVNDVKHFSLLQYNSKALCQAIKLLKKLRDCTYLIKHKALQAYLYMVSCRCRHDIQDITEILTEEGSCTP